MLSKLVGKCSRFVYSWLIKCPSLNGIVFHIIKFSAPFHVGHCFDGTWFSVTHPIPNVSCRFLLFHSLFFISITEKCMSHTDTPTWQYIFLWSLKIITDIYFKSLNNKILLIIWPSRDQVRWTSRVAYPGAPILMFLFILLRMPRL